MQWLVGGYATSSLLCYLYMLGPVRCCECYLMTAATPIPWSLEFGSISTSAPAVESRGAVRAHKEAAASVSFELGLASKGIEARGLTRRQPLVR
jgi:hypothetical protein